jgi:hypothetical protein
MNSRLKVGLHFSAHIDASPAAFGRNLMVATVSGGHMVDMFMVLDGDTLFRAKK